MQAGFRFDRQDSMQLFLVILSGHYVNDTNTPLPPGRLLRAMPYRLPKSILC